MMIAAELETLRLENMRLQRSHMKLLEALAKCAIFVYEAHDGSYKLQQMVKDGTVLKRVDL